MTYYSPCPWCETLAPERPPHVRACCPTCSHRTDLPKALCDCDACLAFAHRHDTPTELDLPALAPTEAA